MSPFDSPGLRFAARQARSLRLGSGSPEHGRGAHGKPSDGECPERGSDATESPLDSLGATLSEVEGSKGLTPGAWSSSRIAHAGWPCTGRAIGDPQSTGRATMSWA